jgi:hypothetical protein
MSDYYAHAIIGCEVPKKKLFKTEFVKGCPHQNATSANFCPQCGKKAWVEEKIFLFEDDNFNAKLNEFGLIIERCTDDSGFVIGLEKFCSPQVDINYNGCYKKAEAVDFTSAREQTMYALDQLGLWNPKAFGLWVVGYCSY